MAFTRSAVRSRLAPPVDVQILIDITETVVETFRGAGEATFGSQTLPRCSGRRQFCSWLR